MEPAAAPAGSEILLMLLADARLPTGAHTQSAGVEAALRAGTPVSAVPEYIWARLATVTRVEAATAVLALRAVRCSQYAGHVDDLVGALTTIDLEWRARTVSAALRENAEQLGRGYLRLLGRLWPRHAGVDALMAMRLPVRAVVVGVAAAAAGLTALQLARLIGYDDAQTAAAAVLKIAPMDPAEVTRWIVGAAPDIESMAQRAALATIDTMPAGSAPELESWAEVHARATQRLFRA